MAQAVGLQAVMRGASDSMSTFQSRYESERGGIERRLRSRKFAPRSGNNRER